MYAFFFLPGRGIPNRAKDHDLYGGVHIEKYLPACLESVAAQTFRDFELIAVDDGSTDRSWEILTEFAKTHPFLRVIRQENQGLSAVRNRMIPLARGNTCVSSTGMTACSPIIWKNYTGSRAYRRGYYLLWILLLVPQIRTAVFTSVPPARRPVRSRCAASAPA